MLSLGIQNDTGGVLFLFVLKGGVSLLQSLYHRQQPSSNTLTWLHQLNVTLRAICKTQTHRITQIHSHTAERCETSELSENTLIMKYIIQL